MLKHCGIKSSQERLIEERRMRVPLIAGNWKMNTTVAEALELVRAMKDELEKVISVEKIV